MIPVIPIFGPIEAPERLAQPIETTSSIWVVVVYDNDFNTYAEVIAILMVATGCTWDEASMEAWEVDHLGRSAVHHGPEEECRRVAEIIATIGIQVEVEEM
jgi:uncharacterized protein YabN with tetrapyrrole methylase and pyrophosphatase domain